MKRIPSKIWWGVFLLGILIAGSTVLRRLLTDDTLSSNASLITHLEVRLQNLPEGATSDDMGQLKDSLQQAVRAQSDAKKSKESAGVGLIFIGAIIAIVGAKFLFLPNTTFKTIKKGLGMAVTLSDQKIKERWGQLIEGGSGKSDSIYKMTQQFLQETRAPGVAWEFTDVKTGMFGSKRVYLLVTNEALKDFRMYIAARDYGALLDVQWYMTVEPGFLKSVVSRAMAGEGGEQALSWNLDIFDQQELSAYAGAVHACLLKAVDHVRRELGQDPSKFNRKSKGFLEVWG